MEIKRFRSDFCESYEIAVAVSIRPKVPYIISYTDGAQNSSVHFKTRKQWEEFKQALKQAEIEAVFAEDETNLESKALRDHAKWCIEKARELEEDDC